MSNMNNKGIGSFIFIPAWLCALVATIGYILDSTKVADTNWTVIGLCAAALIVSGVLEALGYMGMKLDFLSIMPIVFVVLITFAAGMYLRERVDVLGYIFTEHFSFEKDYPELGISLAGFIGALGFGLISNFFGHGK